MVKDTTGVGRVYILGGAEDLVGGCRRVDGCIIGLGILCTMFR